MKLKVRELRFFGVGMELVVSVVLGMLAGRWLDRKLGVAPWASLAGIALGTAAGFRSLFATLRANEAAVEREERAQREGKGAREGGDAASGARDDASEGER
mgnify:CR=1 FL=1